MVSAYDIQREYVPTCHWTHADLPNRTAAALKLDVGFPHVCALPVPIRLHRRSVFAAFASTADSVAVPAGIGWTLDAYLVAMLGAQEVFRSPINVRKRENISYRPWWRGAMNYAAAPDTNACWGMVLQAGSARTVCERVLNLHADTFFIDVQSAPALLQNYWVYLGILSQQSP